MLGLDMRTRKVLAAFSQFDNDVRAERTVAGMKAAIEKGRWTFKAPLGYLNARSKDTPITLMPDPDRAPFVAKAFDLYATGCYNKLQVLKIVTDLGLRTSKGKRLSPQSFDKLLRKPIYAGWLTVPNWGERRRGNFEPLVSQELFDNVQALMDGRRLSVTPHLLNNPDFPLRRFAQCGHCGTPLTGSWSKGRNKRYPYYRCHNGKCNGVKIRREELESSFVKYLENLQPKTEYIALFNEIVLDVWKEKQVLAIARHKALQRQLEELQGRKDKLVDAFVYRKEIDQGTYQEQLDKVNEAITLAEMELNDAKLDELDVEAVLNFSQHLILNAARLWTEFSLEQKQRFQKILFPQGVQFSEGAFRTAATCLIFSMLQQTEAQKERMVAPRGFEPLLPG